VAGKVVLRAPDLRAARRAAQEALAERSGEDGRWSLGLLRPLTPMAPGTHRYQATFAIWTAREDRFVRHDVHTLEVWAADAAGARRLAQQEIQCREDYDPAWRIRDVTRVEGGRRRARAAARR
jgi:hypothetical protein